MPISFYCCCRKYSSRMTASLLAVVIALQPGCVGHAPKPEPAPIIAPEVPATSFQPSLGRVVVAVRVELPELEFMYYAHDKKLAASAASGHASGGFGGGCGGSDIGTCILAQTVVVAAVGLIEGSIAAESAEKKSEEVKESESSVAPVLEASMMQGDLRYAITAAARSDGIKLDAAPSVIIKDGEPEPDYRTLAAKGVDTVLEVTLNQLFLEPAVGRGGKINLDPLLPLDMRAHVRLVKTRDNSLVFSDDYSYHGKRYQYTQWAANDGERLVSGLNKGYESLGRDISERIFLLYPFADRMGTGEAGKCGLGVLSPRDNMAGNFSPLLAWQSFPRESDISADPLDLKQVKNVRYDLVVGSGDNGETPDMFYRIKGLTETSHKLPMRLKPNTRYFWSVRARFDLNGRTRVTDWATDCPFEEQLVVGARLFRFYTP
jgi:hypothetical protein